MIRATPSEPGTPSYADLASPDLDASLAFWGKPRSRNTR